MKNIRQKRSLLFLGLFGLVALIAISPSTLAFSGTALVDNIINTHATQTGDEDDIKYDDDDEVTWEGVMVWPFYLILTRVYFQIKSDVGDDNQLEIEFSFTGGNRFDIWIFYTDASHEVHYEYETSSKTVIFNLIEDKVVNYVKFYSLEWFTGGELVVNYMEVNY